MTRNATWWTRRQGQPARAAHNSAIPCQGAPVELSGYEEQQFLCRLGLRQFHALPESRLKPLQFACGNKRPPAEGDEGPCPRGHVDLPIVDTHAAAPCRGSDFLLRGTMRDLPGRGGADPGVRNRVSAGCAPLRRFSAAGSAAARWVRSRVRRKPGATVAALLATGRRPRTFPSVSSPFGVTVIVPEPMSTATSTSSLLLIETVFLRFHKRPAA